MKKLYFLLLFLVTPLFSFSQITTPAMNMTVECDGSGNMTALNAWLSSHGGAVASTACGTVTWSDNFTSLNDNCGSTGSATVTFTATNTCETATTTATFTVQDTSPPTINTSANDLTVECDGAGNITDLNAWLTSVGGAQASDNCSAVNWSNNFSGLDAACGQTGSTTVTFTVFDGCGNAATETATFTIEDTIPPTITDLSSDMTVICDGSGNTSQLNAWLNSHGGAEAFDNCGEVQWSYSFPGLTSDCSGTVSAEALFTVTDACGNEDYTYSTFTIESAASDCPDTPIVLSSQDDVDAFTANYPNCTVIQEGLTISGSDIISLLPLSNITSILNGLAIENNPLLANLEGLNSVNYIEQFDLVIDNNISLIEISALSNMTTAAPFSYFRVVVSNNPVLNSLNGLQNLQNSYITRIENNESLINLEDLNIQIEELYITNNNALQNFSGITGSFPIEIYIENNQILNDVSALEDLNFEPLYYPLLSIRNNPELFTCDIIPFCTSIFSFYDEGVTSSSYIIENNSFGCNSIPEVAFECGLIPSNDDCNGAIEVELNETIQAYNEFGTQSPQTPSCNDTNRVDVWFTFNSNMLNAVDITVDTDYNVQVWEGTCTSLTQVANACGSNMLVNVAVTPNTDYYLQVWSDGTGRRATGLFEVLVQDATLSVADTNFKGFSIYPNPVNDLLNFKSVKTIDELQVYNLLGQNVMTTTPKTSKTQMDVSGFTSGMYILKVRIGNEMASYKIVKE